MRDELPEPVRPPMTADIARARQWRALQTGLFVAIAYALVHKVLVPLLLKLTPLAGGPYARVDGWAVLPLLLALFLTDARRMRPGASILAGMAVVYGAYEIFELTQGRLVGWLAFSRLLSSIPIAAGCILLLSSRCLPARPLWAWTGAFTLATVLVVAEVQRSFHGF